MNNKLNEIRDGLRIINSDIDELNKKTNLAKMIMILNYMEIRNDYVNILNHFSSLKHDEKMKRILEVSNITIELQNETINNGIMNNTSNVEIMINYLIELEKELSLLYDYYKDEETKLVRNLIIDYIDTLNGVISRSKSIPLQHIK